MNNKAVEIGETELKRPEAGWKCAGNIKENEKPRLILFRLLEKKYPELGTKVYPERYAEYTEKFLTPEGNSIWVDPKLHTSEITEHLQKLLDNPIFRILENKIYMAWVGPEIIFRDFNEEMKELNVDSEMAARLRATIAAYERELETSKFQPYSEEEMEKIFAKLLEEEFGTPKTRTEN